MTWKVHHDGKVREWREKKVRKKLSDGELSGIELVRQPGQDEWRPLHSTDLFRELVPHTGDVNDAIRKRITGSLGSHVALFAIMLLVFTGVGMPTFWFAFWGIGVFMHGYRSYRQLESLKNQQERATDFAYLEEAAAPEPTVAAHQAAAAPQPAAPSLTEDSDLLRALHSLDDSLADTERLRDTAIQLASRRRLAEDAVDLNAVAELQHERASVLADAQRADDTTRVLLEEQAAALEARIGFLQNVEQMAIRLRTRERTLLHQVEALRLGQISQKTASPGADLTASVERLRRELDADAEVSDALARARRAHRT